MSGARHRRKGDRLEREIVERHSALGIKAERYPLSGASRFRGSGHDVDIYTFGNAAAPMVTEVKGRKNGAGFVTLEKWLGEYDGLFLRRNNADPLVFCLGGFGRGCLGGGGRARGARHDRPETCRARARW